MITVLSRPEENAVTMEDLDTLQMELESLLNAVVVRSLNLQREIAGMTDKPSKSGQSFLKGVNLFFLIFFTSLVSSDVFSLCHLESVQSKMTAHPKN